MAMVSGSQFISFAEMLKTAGPLPVHGAPEGADAMLVARAAEEAGRRVIFIARDAQRAAAAREAVRFFAPDLPVIDLPAWDCLPYDRVSPSADIIARRMAALAFLDATPADQPAVIITTVNAALQKVPPREVVAAASFSARPGSSVDIEDLARRLSANGFSRASTVREAGEFAVRGGLLDLFPPGAPEPLRLDFFGDTLESIRAFDPESQRTTAQRQSVELTAASEVLLSEETASRFRQRYLENFGAPGGDPLYEAVSALRMHAGIEHWLAFFYERLETIFDFAGDGLVFLDHQADEAAETRREQVSDYYEARKEDRGSVDATFSGGAYRPVAPDLLYLAKEGLHQRLATAKPRQLSPFSAPEGPRAYDFGAKQGRNFAPERQREGVNVFDAVVGHIKALTAAGKRVALAAWSDGSADRMRSMISDHGLETLRRAADWREAHKSKPSEPVSIVLGLEAGFETDHIAILSEQDVLGDRLVRKTRKRRADNFLTEASSLSVGDLVVHVEHGVGRYEGLKTLEIQGAPHDCLHLSYAGGDKLFLPVENIELLTRYGAEEASAQLDKLGGAGWQSRKAKVRERLKMMAEALIKIAAARTLKKAEVLTPPEGAYDEFCARFPYQETDDQLDAIEDVLDDLAKGRPMDRLVCGDVGFGKTEVAMRAAFTAAMAGRQVAVIAPTTLLVRQHYKNFKERFAGFPLQVRQLSRMVASGEATKVRAGIADGTVDIAIGTHALLSKTVKFDRLGLVIIDEEQHFGVKHKERLKELRADTHVLTLSATPIPRTLQLAMTGIRDLSLIATPPVDRLAVRTTVGPFDAVVARESLLREHYRGGQSFYVCPRIEDLEQVARFLDEQVPEVKYKTAHGQLSPTELEDIMTAFYEGRFDVLVSTTIIESGLDVPSANTLLVHRADMFGLGQLYQIRGRVGRSKARAYAYLTTPPSKKLTATAERRLKVLHSLDTLGAGFTLASHDLDIRGAGNLLGEEQSGRVKEVGVELYQHMLEEAVAAMKSGEMETEETWSPTINIGTAVLIPEDYVQDLDVRMSLYRRLSGLEQAEDIEGFAAELVDRFGPAPDEVEHLLKIVEIKGLCRRANVAKVDAGPKGAVVTFRGDQFPNPAGLVQYIAQSPYDVKLRPDQKLVFKQDWLDDKARLKGAKRVLDLLVEIAEEQEAAA